MFILFSEFTRFLFQALKHLSQMLEDKTLRDCIVKPKNQDCAIMYTLFCKVMKNLLFNIAMVTAKSLPLLKKITHTHTKTSSIFDFQLHSCPLQYIPKMRLLRKSIGGVFILVCYGPRIPKKKFFFCYHL